MGVKKLREYNHAIVRDFSRRHDSCCHQRLCVGLAGERATLGAVQNRLGSAISNLGVSIESQQTAMSRIRDVDFASETANLTQARIMTQSSTAVLSQANTAPEAALQYLSGA